MRKIFPWALLLVSCVLIALIAVVWTYVWSRTTIEIPENYGSIRGLDVGMVSNWTAAANNPNEDRSIALRLSDDSYFAAVFDGHGGTAVSEQATLLFTMEALQIEDLNRAWQNGRETLTKMFATVAKSIEKTQLRKHSENGFSQNGKDLHVGSCALVAWLKKNKLLLANTGDSLAYFFPDNQQSPHVLLNTVIHNINLISEQDKLIREHPDLNQHEIFTCKDADRRTNCRVGGRLQLTRALGDLALAKFVSKIPDVYELTFEESGYIVLASDGLWDELGEDLALIGSLLRDLQKTSMVEKARRIVKLAYEQAAKDRGYTTMRLEIEWPSWNKRKLIDDITVILMRIEPPSTDI